MQKNWQQVGVGKERSGQESKYEHGDNCAVNKQFNNCTGAKQYANSSLQTSGC
jgi:hypothetical protein